jgi:hypothetical protein
MVTPGGQYCDAAQHHHAVGIKEEDMKAPKRTNPGSYPELRMWAEMFADAQADRVKFENRDRSGTIAAEALGPVLELYTQAEKRLEKELLACYRMTVPERTQRWAQETAGVGEHTLARLLGAVGDPRMAYPRHWEGTGPGRHLVDDEPHPRALGQLWQYTGRGEPKNRDVKGDAAALMRNGRPDAKKLGYLMAQSMVKSNAKDGTAYRHVFDENKEKYSLKVHSVDCAGGFSGALYVKCKTHPLDMTLESGQPLEEALPSRAARLGYALAGDPFQPSHVQAIALRHVAKEILRDLWLTAGGQEPVFGTSRAGEEDRRRGRHRVSTWGGVHS